MPTYEDFLLWRKQNYDMDENFDFQKMVEVLNERADKNNDYAAYYNYEFITYLTIKETRLLQKDYTFDYLFPLTYKQYITNCRAYVNMYYKRKKNWLDWMEKNYNEYKSKKEKGYKPKTKATKEVYIRVASINRCPYRCKWKVDELKKQLSVVCNLDDTAILKIYNEHKEFEYQREVKIELKYYLSLFKELDELQKEFKTLNIVYYNSIINDYEKNEALNQS